MVSIKEGKKIMKGINHKLKEYCNDKKEIKKNGITTTVNKIRRLKSTLSLFKSVFDKLVSLILDKKSIDVAKKSQKQLFDIKVDYLLTFLDVKDSHDVEFTPIICNIIPNELLGTAYIGDKPNKIKFEKFYFTEPILNVRQLCDFVENNF